MIYECECFTKPYHLGLLSGEDVDVASLCFRCVAIYRKSGTHDCESYGTGSNRASIAKPLVLVLALTQMEWTAEVLGGYNKVPGQNVQQVLWTI